MRREPRFDIKPPTLNEALDAIAALVGQFAYPAELHGNPAFWHGGKLI